MAAGPLALSRFHGRHPCFAVACRELLCCFRFRFSVSLRCTHLSCELFYFILSESDSLSSERADRTPLLVVVAGAPGFCRLQAPLFPVVPLLLPSWLPVQGESTRGHSWAGLALPGLRQETRTDLRESTRQGAGTGRERWPALLSARPRVAATGGCVLVRSARTGRGPPRRGPCLSLGDALSKTAVTSALTNSRSSRVLLRSCAWAQP